MLVVRVVVGALRVVAVGAYERVVVGALVKRACGTGQDHCVPPLTRTQPGSGGVIVCAWRALGPRLTFWPGMPSANVGAANRADAAAIASNLLQNGIFFAS